MHVQVQRLVSEVKTAIVLEEYATKEQHSVVCFSWAKALNAKNILKEMFPVYSGKCLSCKVVHDWVKKSSRHSKSQMMPDQVALFDTAT
jgi:hypothetical protein